MEHPETFLSERALARRASQGVAVDSTDLPVCRAYIERWSRREEIHLIQQWNNTVLMQVPDEAIALRFLDNSFVRSIKKVWVSPDSIMPRNKDRKEQVKNQWKKQDDYYGMGAEQIKIHHGDSLHLAGFKGKGIQIAVIDAGFYNVDAMKIFKNTTILGTHDFVNPSSDIYGEHNHGMKVLSCMAVNTPHVMVGTAPEASYWLLRSEDNDTEQPVEEDNWAAAVEFADSVGVDIVNTSLGYYSFDDPIDNYTYRQLDGHTSLMAASASYAAKKGLLVVCSAGNSGMDEWKKITPPADAEDIGFLLEIEPASEGTPSGEYDLLADLTAASGTNFDIWNELEDPYGNRHFGSPVLDASENGQVKYELGGKYSLFTANLVPGTMQRVTLPLNLRSGETENCSTAVIITGRRMHRR